MWGYFNIWKINQGNELYLENKGKINHRYFIIDAQNVNDIILDP